MRWFGSRAEIAIVILDGPFHTLKPPPDEAFKGKAGKTLILDRG